MVSASQKRAAEDSDHAAVSNINSGFRSKKVRFNPEEQPQSRSKVDANGDRYWDVSRLRRVTISSFRGKTLVNIREYYEKNGQELPGKKGISMPIDQFSSLVTLLPEIEIALKENGESLPRPDYSSVAIQSDESGAGVQREPSGRRKDAASSKKNIEATSEEDEGEE